MHKTEKAQPLVLIGDDDATFRMLARKSLENEGFRVAEAEDGIHVCFVCERSQPDLVILDVKMPKLDGFKACAKVRQIPEMSRTPILMITGLDDTESINKAYHAGATDFITKPINWLMLGFRVRFLLRANEEALAFIQRENKTDRVPSFAVFHEDWPAIEVEVLENIRALGKETDSDLLMRTIEMYLDIAPTLIDTIRKSILDNNKTLLHLAATQLQSQSALFGAGKLTLLCRELSSPAYSDSLFPKHELLPRIESEFERVKQELTNKTKNE